MINMDTNFFNAGMIPGLIGGVLFHCYWLRATGHSAKGIAVSGTKADKKFRFSLLTLSAIIGACVGFLVFVWFFVELQTGLISVQKVVVLAALAGLSSDSIFRILSRI